MPDEVLDNLSVGQREEMWRQLLSADERLALYVAVKDGAVVGFCAVLAPGRDRDAADRDAEIAAVYVDPEVWRTGIGRALMNTALADLLAGGWSSVTLWVLAQNRRALDFYAHFGFEPDGAEMTDQRSGAAEVRLRASITGESPRLGSSP